MRNYIYIIRYAFIAVFALLAAGCMDDNDSAPGSKDKPSQAKIVFGSPRIVSDGDWQNGRLAGAKANEFNGMGALLRATPLDVESEIPDDLGIFAFGDGQNTTYIFKNQKAYFYYGPEFFYDATTGAANNGRFSWNYVHEDSNNPGNYVLNEWPYTTDPTEQASVQQPWEKMRYKFFAYSPWRADNVRVSAENYSGFNSFTWDNIPGFSDKDYVLSNDIHNIDNSDGTRTTPEKVTFAMRHILSRIRFFFKMSEAYRYVRKIEINSITVLTAGKVKTATFNFTNGALWDGTVHWSNEQPGDADPVTLINRTKDPLNPYRYILNPNYEVKTTYPAEPYSSVYVYPQAGFKELKMQINYSVYDSKDVKTRETQVVNIVTIKTPDNKGWTLLSGYYYDIYITIAPSYLYVLSDNDKVYDGAVIITDN